MATADGQGKNLLSNLRLNQLTWICVALFLAAIAARLSLNKYFPDVAGGALYDAVGMFFDALAQGAFAFLLTNIMWEYYAGKEMEDRIGTAIAGVIGANKGEFVNIVSKFPSDKLHEIFGGILSDRFGQTRGELLMGNSFVGSLDRLEANFPIRRNFTYAVELAAMGADASRFQAMTSLLALSDLEAFRRDYLVCAQEMSCAVEGGKLGEQSAIRVIFAFDDKALDKLLNDDGVFFREVLRVDGDVKRAMREALRRNADEVLAKAFSFVPAIPSLERTLDWHAVYDDAADLIDITIQTGGEHARHALSIAFAAPHRAADSWFLVSFAVPTEKPRIIFDCAVDGYAVFDFPFFAGNAYLGGKVNKRRRRASQSIDIDVDAWVIPRSGVLFVWNRHEAS